MYLKCQRGIPPTPIAAQLHFGHKHSQVSTLPCGFSCLTRLWKELVLPTLSDQGCPRRTPEGQGNCHHPGKDTSPGKAFIQGQRRLGWLDTGGVSEVRLLLLISHAYRGDWKKEKLSHCLLSSPRSVLNIMHAFFPCEMSCHHVTNTRMICQFLRHMSSHV